jgi:hypothetical protein
MQKNRKPFFFWDVHWVEGCLFIADEFDRRGRNKRANQRRQMSDISEKRGVSAKAGREGRRGAGGGLPSKELVTPRKRNACTPDTQALPQISPQWNPPLSFLNCIILIALAINLRLVVISKSYQILSQIFEIITLSFLFPYHEESTKRLRILGHVMTRPYKKMANNMS